MSWQEQKEQQAKERKRKNDLKKTEEEIAKLEERNTVIDEELTKEEIYSNSIECQKLSTERAENEEKLEVLYERWERVGGGSVINFVFVGVKMIRYQEGFLTEERPYPPLLLHRSAGPALPQPVDNL